MMLPRRAWRSARKTPRDLTPNSPVAPRERRRTPPVPSRPRQLCTVRQPSDTFGGALRISGRDGLGCEGWSDDRMLAERLRPRRPRRTGARARRARGRARRCPRGNRSAGVHPRGGGHRQVPAARGRRRPGRRVRYVCPYRPGPGVRARFPVRRGPAAARTAAGHGQPVPARRAAGRGRGGRPAVRGGGADRAGRRGGPVLRVRARAAPAGRPPSRPARRGGRPAGAGRRGRRPVGGRAVASLPDPPGRGPADAADRRGGGGARRRPHGQRRLPADPGRPGQRTAAGPAVAARRGRRGERRLPGGCTGVLPGLRPRQRRQPLLPDGDRQGGPGGRHTRHRPWRRRDQRAGAGVGAALGPAAAGPCARRGVDPGRRGGRTGRRRHTGPGLGAGRAG